MTTSTVMTTTTRTTTTASTTTMTMTRTTAWTMEMRPLARTSPAMIERSWTVWVAFRVVN